MVIDVWASWCSPCIQAIPYYKKLVEKYKNNSKIKFISISIDEDRNKWLEALAKEKPNWENYWLNDQEIQQFTQAYEIGPIPRFIILNKDGSIAVAEANHPAYGLEAQIQKILK